MLFRSILILVFFFILSGAVLAQSTNPNSTDSGTFIDVKREPKETIPIESLIVYPKEAQKHGIEGTVTLEVVIDTNGNVCKVHILKSSDTIFDSEAIRAMKSAHFIPALLVNGEPVKIWITRTVHFNLKRN
jgi:TonB family protein